jgi:co-chaperonin GroES (HSP10)
MKFRPLHDRVVVRRVDAEEKSAGGIIIPDTARKNPSKARWSPSVQARVTSRAG